MEYVVRQLYLVELNGALKSILNAFNNAEKMNKKYWEKQTHDIHNFIAGHIQ